MKLKTTFFSPTVQSWLKIRHILCATIPSPAQRVRQLSVFLMLMVLGVGNVWGETYEWSHDGQKSTLTVTAAKGTSDVSKYTGYSISYGEKIYSSAVKMESATTLTFTTSNTATITIGVALKNGSTYSNAGKTALQLTTNSSTNAVTANTGITESTDGATEENGLEIVFAGVAAGTQVITRAGSEEGVFYIKVEEEAHLSLPIKKWSGYGAESTVVEEDFSQYLTDNVGGENTLNAGDIVIGTSDAGFHSEVYAKLDDWKTMHFEGDAGTKVRVIYNYDGSTLNELTAEINGAGFADINIAGLNLSYFHVNGIKITSDSSGKISKIEEKDYFTTYYNNYTDGGWEPTTYGTATLPSPTRTGYTCTGWVDAGTSEYIGACGASYTPTSSRYLNAQWEDNSTKYEVKYELFGHGSTTGLPSEANAVPSISPSDDYYNFEGWYTDQALASAVTAGDAITAVTTLYAKWTKKTAIVSISDNTTLTFSSVPSNTINFDWYGNIQASNDAHTTATEAGADSRALKFDSKASLKFETSDVFTLDLFFEDTAAGKTIKIDNVEKKIGSNGHLTIENFSAGTHTIARMSDQVFLYVLKLSSNAVKASDFEITPSEVNVEINTNSTPFTITSSSDGLLSITSVSNNKVSALIDDNGQLLISTSSATAQGVTIKVAQAATSRYEAGEVTVTVNVVKPTLAAPTISCTDNAVTITSSVDGATIYYTTDGSDPKTSNTKQVYSGVFLISQNGTVRAYATANNYNDSESASQDVTYTEISQYTYAVNAVDGDGNLIKTLASGVVKNEAVTVYYPIIIKEGNTYYKTSATTFAQTFAVATSSSASDTRNITYVADASIVGYVEGENATLASSGNESYSNGASGHVNAQNWNCRGLDIATKLTAGKYTFTTNVVEASSAWRGVVLRNVTGLGNSQEAPITCSITTSEVQESEFTITSESSFRINGNNSNNKSSQSADFDYAYISRQNAVVITTQPVGGNYGLNSTQELSVAAAAYYNGDVVPTYQWYSNTTNSTEGGTAISGATNATYTPSATSEGRTYYYCVVSYAEGGNTISATSDIAEFAVCKHNVSTTNIGKEDNTSEWWNDFSDFYSLSNNESREFTFKNYSSGAQNYHNWVLYAGSAKNHNGDADVTLSEYVGLRADNWDNNATEHTGVRTVLLPDGAVNWDTFKSDMQKGATVTVKIARKDNQLFLYAKSVADQGDNPTYNTYVTTYTKTVSDMVDPMYCFFVVDHSHITDLTASAVKPIYSISASVNGENGSVKIINAEGMEVPAGTYFSLGDEVRVVATPNTGYDDYAWESSGTQGAVDPVNNTYIINYINADTEVTVTFAQNSMSFANTTPSVNLEGDGTATYTQQVTGAPEGETPVYTVVSTDGVSASISQEEGSADYTLQVRGTGTVVVAASCGGMSAIYTLSVHGLAFAKAYDIYKFDGNYTQAIKDEAVTDETYEIVEKYGEIASTSVTINSLTGEISGLPSFDDNKGGAIVVKATKGTNSATYTLTIPYKKYVWNFYQEGEGYSNTNPVSRIVTGPLVNKTNPGAADLVSDKDANGNLIDISSIPLQPIKDEATLQYDLRKRQNWLNEQAKSDVKANANDPHNYWNYTFKTMSYLSDKKTVTYTNEALFSYKNPVHGDNARVITNTQGLVFNCDANKFGLNDNRTTVEPYMNNGQVYYTARNIREMDRAVLLKGYSQLTIPHVKAGYYVKLYWYRHSDNAGDQFRVQNAKDLDGRNINPNDVLRFTGSAYYRNPAISSYRGCTFLQPQNDGDDITITIANANWTELYRIEVTDKFETDLKICEEEIAGYKNGDQAYAGTDMWNALDINDPTNYNTLTHSHIASMLTSKIQTFAKGHQLISYAPEIHFSGYPGHCFTWNGWLNTTLQTEVEGSAKCATATNTENNVANALPIDPVWVGNNIRYTAHHLKEVQGTGTIKLTLRTHSGNSNEPHYTLDKTEATVAVGEYSVQDYPYTWDFTKYNLDKTNAYNGKTFKGMETDWISVTNRYGHWNGTDSHVMDAYTSLINSGTAEAPTTSDGHQLNAADIRHKPFFAQGAQLNLGDGEGGKPRTVLESEGLRINIPAVDASNNNAVTWTEGDDGALTVNGTITIPEVQQGMYVFVRTSVKPSVSIEGETVEETRTNSVHVSFYTDNTDVEMKTGDIRSNVYVYKQTLEGKHDVVITPDATATVDALGVTDYFKPMVQFQGIARATWVTDSRNERIDYLNTGVFTNHNLQAYVTNNIQMKGGASNLQDSENGTMELKKVNVIPSSATHPDNRGLVLEDKIEEGTTCTPRPLLPLFVPACNITDDDISGNSLIGCISGDIEIAASNSSTYNYVLTNQYYDWDWAEKKKQTEAGKYDHMVDETSFYILREKGLARPNSAYLSISAPTTEVKQLYMITDADWADDEEATGIDTISLDTENESVTTKDIYTLTGVKLDAMPTEKGVYIINGKKTLIK